MNRIQELTLIIASLEADLSKARAEMDSLTGTILVTEQMLHDAATSGCGWNRKQLEFIGQYPLKKGWTKRFAGTRLSCSQWKKFLDLKTNKPSVN